MAHYFEPYILLTETQEHIPVTIEEMTRADAESTNLPPVWQTDWTSDFISNPEYLKYAVRTPEGELVALGDGSAPRYILFGEAAKKIFLSYLS